MQDTFPLPRLEMPINQFIDKFLPTTTFDKDIGELVDAILPEVGTFGEENDAWFEFHNGKTPMDAKRSELSRKAGSKMGGTKRKRRTGIGSKTKAQTPADKSKADKTTAGKGKAKAKTTADKTKVDKTRVNENKYFECIGKMFTDVTNRVSAALDSAPSPTLQFLSNPNTIPLSADDGDFTKTVNKSRPDAGLLFAESAGLEPSAGATSVADKTIDGVSESGSEPMVLNEVNDIGGGSVPMEEGTQESAPLDEGTQESAPMEDTQGSEYVDEPEPQTEDSVNNWQRYAVACEWKLVDNVKHRNDVRSSALCLLMLLTFDVLLRTSRR